jgi:hypothetical protein
MHVAIREAMDAASATIDAVKSGDPIPAFFVDP